MTAMNNFRLTTRSHLMLVVLSTLGVLCACGCASTKRSWKFAKNGDFKRAVGLKSDKPLPPETPVRLVSTWTDTVLNQPGKPPQRGFGGKLIFFKPDSEEPVRVDGQLVVYAFDESDREAHETHPSRKYVFPRDEFLRHESETQLGASYSVWLPWDEVGGNIKQISLIARFEPHGGSTVLGEQTKHLLPGVSKDNPEMLVSPGVGKVDMAQHTERTKLQTVRQLSAEAPVEPNIVESTEMPKAETKPITSSSTTIALPKKWERRLGTK
jgi:hypothetical protein